MNEEPRYDVVIDVLQKHRDKLWDMTKNNTEWGICTRILCLQVFFT